MSIEKRLERIEAILDARGLDWDHPRVEDVPVKDSLPDIRALASANLRWRILGRGDSVQSGDWAKLRKSPKESEFENGGWVIAPSCYFGKDVSSLSGMLFARPTSMKPKLRSGEAYRLLSKEMLEDLAQFGGFGMGAGILVASNHFADANKMVVEEPPKKWRILEPGEVVQEGDWVNAKTNPSSDPPNGGGWVPAEAMLIGGKSSQAMGLYVARPVAEEPANKAEPAWEPKIGDWVLVTRPQNWKEWKDPLWREEMHIYDGRVFELVKWSRFSTGRRASLQGIDWFFHRDWLSPAEPPEPEYREPVLPADEGEWCEFSVNGNDWTEAKLRGYAGYLWQSVSSERVGVQHWVHARIKKDS